MPKRTVRPNQVAKLYGRSRDAQEIADIVVKRLGGPEAIADLLVNAIQNLPASSTLKAQMLLRLLEGQPEAEDDAEVIGQDALAMMSDDELQQEAQ